MVTPLDVEWLSFNQRVLANEIARVRALLGQPAAEDAPPALESLRSLDASSQVTEAVHPTSVRPPTVEALRAAFGLTTFERDLVLLCAGMELDASVAMACGAAHGDPQRSF